MQNKPIDHKRFQQQIAFIIEIDKMKTELRKNILVDKSRRENDAEHSWHIAVMAMLLEEYSDLPVDMLKVIKILLVHDIVEIYAGDTFFYDEQANLDKAEREQAAADRIFAMLPTEQGQELRNLWEEYEAQQTNEALYAGAMDRLQPFLLHYYTQGQVWREEHVTGEKIYKRIGSLKLSMPRLWPVIDAMIQEAIAKGYVSK